MNTPDQLHHNLIKLPKGKTPGDIVGERHEFVLLFDCAKSNPNGDPDTGNMPRVQPDSLKGLVTDVCLKRKIRNFFTLYCPHDSEARPWRDENDKKESRNGYDIFIREGAVLQELFDPDTKKADALVIENMAKEIFSNELGQQIEAWTAKETKKGKGRAKMANEQSAEANLFESIENEPAQGEESAQAEEVSPAKQAKQRAFQLAVLRTFFDLRAFGGVLSTEGPLKGSFYGQIRGPIQFTFSESLDKVLPLDATITRCAVASLKEAQKQESDESGDSRTMGRKHAIDYGLYRCHIHFSPAFAAKTGFTYYDLDNFLFALTRCFGDYNVDIASARAGGMSLVGLVDFAHSSALGNAPAHKLFELVKVEGVKYTKEEAEQAGKPELKGKFKSSGSEFPQDLRDYIGSAPNGSIYVEKNEYQQVIACTEKKPDPKDGNEPVAPIIARRIIWTFKEPQKPQAQPSTIP